MIVFNAIFKRFLKRKTQNMHILLRHFMYWTIQSFGCNIKILDEVRSLNWHKILKYVLFSWEVVRLIKLFNG